MDYLQEHNRRIAGDKLDSHLTIDAKGKRVVVLGGGDTGSDCVGTAMRQGASSITQLELMPKPPLVRIPQNPWPEWPLVLRTSSSQEEAAHHGGADIRDFAVSTRNILADETGRVRALEAARVAFVGGKIVEQENSKFEIPCDLLLLAMGFVGPQRKGIVEDLGLALDARGNIATNASGATNVDRIFSAGDASRGQSLVVWAIADGRRVAEGVDSFLRRAVRKAG
jgi:glutamate synthase (NADPH/NADH) small chain